MLSSCRLCPRECGIDRMRGETGFCSLDSKIKIARSALHYWEEPCISGKNGAGTVFFSGCNMKCIYCQNYEISHGTKGKTVSEEELADEFLRLENLGAHNIELVTPTHYVPNIIKALDIARLGGLNLPVVYNSGGYEKEETIESLRGYVDIFMPDMKYFSNKYAMEYSLVPNYFDVAKKALSAMVNMVGEPIFDKDGMMQRGVIVRHMMLPGALFDTKKIIDYLANEYGDKIYISLMSQYTPTPSVCSHRLLSKRINKAHYDTMAEYIEYLGLKNVFLQDVSSAEEGYIPEFEY